MSDEKLKKLYDKYQVIDWIIAIAVIGTPILVYIIALMPEIIQGNYISDAAAIESWDAIMSAIAGLPAWVMLPLFTVYTGYTVFTIWLYIKVWHLKEIRNTFVYWFDWVLTLVLLVYELFIFYVILF